MPTLVQPIFALVSCGILFLSLSACAGSRPASSSASVQTSLLYQACMERCMENTELGVLTKEGCIQGCNQASKSFPLNDKSFKTLTDCEKALTKVLVDLNKRIIKEQTWCLRQWTHLHHRKGCKDAIAVYYNELTNVQICHSDQQGLTQSPLQGTSIEQDLLHTLLTPPILDTPKVQSSAKIQHTPSRSRTNKQLYDKSKKQSKAIPPHPAATSTNSTVPPIKNSGQTSKKGELKTPDAATQKLTAPPATLQPAPLTHDPLQPSTEQGNPQSQAQPPHVAQPTPKSAGTLFPPIGDQPPALQEPSPLLPLQEPGQPGKIPASK